MKKSRVIITLNELQEYEKFLQLEREQLSIYNSPLKTLSLFFIALWYYSRNGFLFVLNHPVVVYLFLPVIGLWSLLEFYPNFPYSALINDIEFVILYLVWWVGLGISFVVLC